MSGRHLRQRYSHFGRNVRSGVGDCQSTRKYVVDGNLAGDFTDENVGKCRLLDQWRNRRLPLLILRGAWRRQLRGGNPI
jgi:hypothetical protein